MPMLRTLTHLCSPAASSTQTILRVNKDAQRFARDFFEAGKPVAAICHGPWLLIDAEVVKGRDLTFLPYPRHRPAQRRRQLE